MAQTNYEIIGSENLRQLTDFFSSPEYRQQQIAVWQGMMQEAQARGDEKEVESCWNKLTYYMYPFRRTRRSFFDSSTATGNKSVE